MTFPRLLTGDYLFSSPTDPPTIWFHILTAAFVILFLFALFIYWRRGKLAPDNPVQRRLMRRASKAAMWTSGIGIFLAIMRYTQFPYLSMPIFMYLLLLSMIGIVGYFVYDISEHYPVAVHQLEESRLERRYRPAARPARPPQRARPTRERGKQRRR